MEVEDRDLPYRAEYSKSARAACRGCKLKIGKDVLRLAVLVQSPMFDGKMTHWYHMNCFFGKQRPKTIADIAHFESLRYEDQNKIREKIENAGAVATSTKKGKKRAKDTNDDASASTSGSGGGKVAGLTDFRIEYAKSGRAGCRGCEQKILKDQIRISKKDFDSDVGKRYGGQDMWHHVECFAKLRSEFNFFETGARLPGFMSLKIDDQKLVKQELPAIKQEDLPSPAKKLKTEDQVDSTSSTGKEDQALEKKIKEQSKIIYKYRDLLKADLKKEELQLLFECNEQQVPSGVERMLDRLSDLMSFGALEPCSNCKTGQFTFRHNGYACLGDLTEWTKCQAVVKEPKRKPFLIPDELKSKHEFLGKYKYVPRTRLMRLEQPTVVAKVEKKDELDSGKPRVERAKPALLDMRFILEGFDTKTSKTLTKMVEQLGGKILKRFTKRDRPLAVISTVESLTDKKSSNITQAELYNIHVVTEDFVHEAKNRSGQIVQLIDEKSICNWGSDPTSRMPVEKSSNGSKSSKSKSIFTKSVPSKMKFTMKDGGAVDPASGLENAAHIYQSGSDKYNAVLGLTDLQKNKNSFYKIQLLESDTSKCYWVFRAWGRIATTIGGNKVDRMDSLYAAIKLFKELYEDKSGNLWVNRHNFVKIPNRMYPIDVEFDDDDEEKMLQMNSNSVVESKLHSSVQDLIKLLFDVNTMKKVMLEFELDMEKMPLGKLSKKQIHSAFSVLSEIQDLINNNSNEAPKFIDTSNRFYTFIPHSFGIENPPLINTAEMIKEKLDMLDSLLELEIAYSIMKKTAPSSSGDSGSHIDRNYEQLNTDLEPLPRDHEDFAHIKEYVKNTHAQTHSSYSLDIEEIFVVRRHGEEKRFKPFRKLHNRKLLWHGSRLTNFVGILSQGLRIAPPEAPVTGYMFGKGIYFADMVSKSANYCFTNNDCPTGLMLLCEVALGDMYERTGAENIQTLPKGKHSCKGIGQTHPDPKKSVKKDDGLEIPLGNGIKNNSNSSLLYNEYIVYDVAQVNVKYLLKLNFNYKY